MIYPDSFENKIGFSAFREILKGSCISGLGRERCDSMSFSSDFNVVEDKLNSTFEMMTIINSGEDFPLDGFVDVTALLDTASIAGTFLPASDFMQLRKSLMVIVSLASFFNSKRHEEGSEYPCLDKIAVMLQPFPLTVKSIDRVVDMHGEVKDSASPELAEIRHRLAATVNSINSTMRRVMSNAVQAGYIDNDTAPSMRDGRLVIPVAPMNKRKISGIVHDESASGKTVYIEPAEIVEANNRIRELRMEERHEIARILTLLTDELRPHIDDIRQSMEVMGEMDFIRAKARFAIDIDGRRPSVVDAPEMEWFHAVHPGLLLSLRRQGKEVVPLDMTLTPENRILIISGPNAGGKSVCLKTVGVIQYMLQCGLLPPVYENSHFGIFDNIFVDIGDDQSLEDDLSTYSSHLRNMKLFLQRGKNGTLVLIDEFGGGTEPQIGGAIAQAILKRFNEQRIWGVITTHYQNLKQFAEDTPGLINGSMLYDRHLMQPMFKLSIGNPGSSFAVEIARKIGLPEGIISDAEEIVGSDYINMDKYLLDIARDKRYWENKRLAIRQKEKKLETSLARYEDEATQLRESRRAILSEAKEEARKILEGSNAVIERTIHDIKKAQAEKDRTIEARRRLAEEKERLANGKDSEHPLLKKAPKSKKAAKPQESKNDRPVAVGDNVKLDGQGEPGKVLKIEGKNAIVAFGLLETTVKLDRLKLTVAKPRTGASATVSVGGALSDSQRDKQLNFNREIDLRGMRVDEAIQALTYYIDDAIRFNASTVRILHGTGTGALRQYLRQYLDTVPGVKNYRDEHVQFGGAGITVVDLA
ncbi:MAG: Smr/MutS family protein [Bacteroides sp.]|nr:Smr/MutS family protein [Bacteroides sp.]MCM1388915.1 Smr/MutS family protein [Bacteroides sp.]